MLVGFDPIIAEKPQVMILGSMPSVTSLQLHQYYGYRHNRFWRILSAYFAMPIETYEQKTEIILRRHLVLWDVIHACEREGSLDSSIHHEIVNPIDQLIQTYPKIHTVICNGKKSEALYQRHFAHLPLRRMYLPSTSNANRTIREEELFERWMQGLHTAFHDRPSETEISDR